MEITKFPLAMFMDINITGWRATLLTMAKYHNIIIIADMLLVAGGRYSCITTAFIHHIIRPSPPYITELSPFQGLDYLELRTFIH